jgi:carbon-monoxide dehydrogenase medium subunit
VSERSVPIETFFKGPGKTVLQPGEIVTEFSIPLPLPRTGMAYTKHTRRKAMDLPILGVAVLLSFNEDLSTCTRARIAIGVAAPTPMRAKQAEAFLEGQSINEKRSWLKQERLPRPKRAPGQPFGVPNGTVET